MDNKETKNVVCKIKQKFYEFKASKEAKKKQKEAQKRQEIIDEAADRIRLRKIDDLTTGDAKTVICLDGVIIYEATPDDNTICARLFNLRDIYVNLMSEKPTIELR